MAQAHGEGQTRREISVPVFVIQGAEDFTTPASLARGSVDSIRAPRKQCVPLAGGGHFAMFMQPDRIAGKISATGSSSSLDGTP